MLPFLFTRPDKTIHDLDWTKGGGGVQREQEKRFIRDKSNQSLEQSQTRPDQTTAARRAGR